MSPSPSLSRRALLTSAAAVVAGGPSALAATQRKPLSKKRPNILLVVADDLGVDASPVHPSVGAQNIKPSMPNVERLAASGVTFETCFVNPVCSPTRSSMLTGQYGFRTKVLTVDDQLDAAQPTVFKRLKQAGDYTTAVIGKWHLGGNPAPLDHPARCGVDYFAGFMQGGVPDYSNWSGVEGRGAALKPFTSTTYVTTWITDKAIAWAKERAKAPTKPWMLALTYNAPHAPLHLPPANLHRRTTLTGERPDIRQRPIEYYAAAAEALDTEFGRFLASLTPSVRANTVIIFIGDNGTLRRVIQAPFAQADGKGSVKAGGVHVPLVVSGAGVTRKGSRSTALVNGVDVYRTITDLAQLTPEPAGGAAGKDSVSFVSSLNGSGGGTGRSWMYSEAVRAEASSGEDEDAREPVNGWTVRDTRFQLVRDELAGTDQLFDVQADPGQQTNLADDPERADDIARLKAIRVGLVAS